MTVGWEYGRGNAGVWMLAAGLLLGWPLVPIAIAGGFVWFILRPLVKAAWHHPITAAALAAITTAAVFMGPVEAAGFVVGLVLVLAVELTVWRLADPETFARFVSGPVVVRRRRGRYRRRWVALMTSHGLGLVYTQPRRRGVKRTTVVPRLMSMSCGRWRDVLVVRPIGGQALDQYEKACPALAMHLGSRSVKAVAHADGLVRFEIARGDRLETPIPALPVLEQVDLSALPVGLREDGTPWTVSLVDGSHTFIGGVTMAGKSSVVWSILRALAPAVRDGWVQLWGLDPKIMEFTYGPGMFHRLETSRDPLGMVGLLEDAVRLMHERADRLAGTARTHRPTPDDPFIVILIDELAFLTAYAGTKQLRDRITQAISVLCTQGRAAGIEVVAAAQDVRKDVVSMRNLFPVKIALRLDEKTQVDMLLGDGARDQGALCDQIPDRLPGVGYVKADSAPAPIRVRAAYVSDADIRDLAERYPAPANRPPVADVLDGQGDGPDDTGPGLRSVA